MQTRISYNTLKRLFLVICVFFFSALNAQAYNVLSGVYVKQSDNNSYNITLKVNNSVKIKKVPEAQDNLTIVLDSVVPTDSVDVVYDNASDLKNVMVQKKNADKTVIVFQGKNIENAKIYTKELSTGVVKPFDENSLKNYLYVANVKYLTIGIIGSVFLFFLLISLRPKSKRYSVSSTQTLRNKINSNNRYIPSINYKINSVKSNATVPKEFVISKINTYQEQRIRKAG